MLHTRDIPNAHHSLIKENRVKDLFPDMQFTKAFFKELDNKLLIMASNACDRAKKNGRKRLFPHDA